MNKGAKRVNLQEDKAPTDTIHQLEDLIESEIEDLRAHFSKLVSKSM